MLMALPIPIPVDLTRDWFDVLALVVSAFAAVGTLLAVFFSVWVATRSWRDGRRAEASRVTAWPGDMDRRIPDTVLHPVVNGATWDAPERPIIVIRNDSGSTIHNVLIAYSKAWSYHKVAPDEPMSTPLWQTMVPPGDWYVGGPGYHGEAHDYRSGLMIEFTDANGRRWMRAADGSLARSNQTLLARMQKESKPDNSSLKRL
ncbi:hypothetical protein ABFC64_12705 [Microbacterium rhizosphaerae]|uniref:Uncharacterized protein n=1 Tax=Microbacterium rhizosphaerae TaxID=1678237 RepID=A0ABZ0SJV0_9MICO|nr:hypothetical protein [Microbacterium rhizosphaerae]WPR88399.1 hypothetical protein SM116_11480 [Microbacterium rhizosphaerae]